MVEGPGDGGEGSPQKPGDMPEVQPLMAEFHGLLQLLRIVRPPLGQAGIGVAMHGAVRSRLVGRTSTRSGLTPLCH
jgi:hypothetical protein